MALSGQLFKQLKQSTHREWSMSQLRKSMHEDLQAREHLPHLVHFSLSNLILRRDIFESSPRNVPTGQTVLQYNRPLVKDNIPTRRKNATGIE
jgi:hypothetical protein